MIWFLFVLLIFGLIAGAIARFLVPGPDPMSIGGTWLLGVGGSFLGGFLGAVIFGFDTGDGIVQVAGVVGSIVGSIIILLIRRWLGRRQSATA